MFVFIIKSAQLLRWFAVLQKKIIVKLSERKYTWNNNTTTQLSVKTRIDQIWASQNWAYDTMYSDIEDMDLISNSDHHMAITLFNTSHMG